VLILNLTTIYQSFNQEDEPDTVDAVTLMAVAVIVTVTSVALTAMNQLAATVSNPAASTDMIACRPLIISGAFAIPVRELQSQPQTA
jgi:hypothetical protein